MFIPDLLFIDSLDTFTPEPNYQARLEHLYQWLASQGPEALAAFDESFPVFVTRLQLIPPQRIYDVKANAKPPLNWKWYDGTRWQVVKYDYQAPGGFTSLELWLLFGCQHDKPRLDFPRFNGRGNQTTWIKWSKDKKIYQHVEDADSQIFTLDNVMQLLDSAKSPEAKALRTVICDQPLKWIVKTAPFIRNRRQSRKPHITLYCLIPKVPIKWRIYVTKTDPCKTAFFYNNVSIVLDSIRGGANDCAKVSDFFGYKLNAN